jgi:hypothetical protein
MAGHLTRELEELESSIVNYRQVVNDPEVAAWADQKFDGLDVQYQRLVADNGYHNHLLQYISEAHDSLTGDGGRDEPLCTCDRNCALKRGTLPPAVRMADSLDDGISDFELSHPGTPSVLIDAREAWFDRAREVRREMKAVHIALKRERLPVDAQAKDEEEEHDAGLIQP